MPTYRSFAEQGLHYFIRQHENVPGPLVHDPAAWRGADMKARTQDWLHILDEDDLTALEYTAQSLMDKGVSLEDVTRETFTLPAALCEKIAAWHTTLISGRGFLVVRGLPVANWGDDFSSYVYWGLGHHIGVPGAQNPQNELLGHVTDYGEEVNNPAVRRYRTTGNIDFHCDAADVVGLLCLRKAKSGGQSRIASSVTIYNEICARAPALAARLFEPFKLDLRGEHRAGEPPYRDITPCAFAGGRLSTFWHSDYFHSVARHAEVPPFTEAEQALLELYDALAADPDIHLDMWLEPGDMQFISNHTTVHARTAYEDDDDPAKKRHLLRLWLSLQEEE